MFPTSIDTPHQLFKSVVQRHQAGVCEGDQGCVPHRWAKRKYIGQEGPLVLGKCVIRATRTAEEGVPAIQADQAVAEISLKGLKLPTSASIVKWEVRSPFSPSHSDKLRAPSSSSKSARSPGSSLTKKASIFSLGSFMGTITPSSTRTWTGSHFEIGADIEEVLKQTSLIAGSSDHPHTTRARRPSISALETPNLKRPASLGSPVRKPSRLRRFRSLGTSPNSTPFRSEFLEQDIPAVATAHQYPQRSSGPSRPRNPSCTAAAPTSPADFTRPAVPLSPSQTVKFTPPAQVSTSNEAMPDSNVAPPPQSFHQILLNDSNPSKANLTDERMPIASIMEAYMLVKFQWADRNPARLSNKVGPRVLETEEPFKPYKVVLEERALHLYQCSRSMFQGNDKWKLIHSIPLEKDETQLSRPFSSELAFCLTVNLRRGSTFFLQSNKSPSSKFDQGNPKPPARRPFYTNRPVSPKARSQRPSRATIVPIKVPGRIANFIFIACTKSVGDVLAYQLWQRVGGKTPNDVLVDVIGVSSNVRVSITRNREGQMVHLSEAELRQATIRCLTSDKDYATLYAQLEAKGRDLKLAWRREDRLDWITPVPRHIVLGKLSQEQLQLSSLMRGIATQRVKNRAVLEIRPALHYPNFVTLPNGSVSREPSGLEGFVSCPGPVPKRVYLSTFDGVLFICKPSLAVPPRAPISGVEREHLLKKLQPNSSTFGCGSFFENSRLAHYGSTTSTSSARIQASNLSLARSTQTSNQARKLSTVDEDPASSTNPYWPKEIPDNEPRTVTEDALLVQFYASETSRQKRLVRNSYKLIYMTDIKYASEVSAEEIRLHKPSLFQSKRPALQSSEGEPSGFQIHLETNSSIKFEVGSKAEADQWAQHLTSLSAYWKQRTKEDAQVEMMAQPKRPKAEATHVPGLMQPSRATLEPASSEELKISLLSSLYHRCAVEGCRTITRVGKLNVQPCRAALWHAREVVLCGGQLIEYRQVVQDFWGRQANQIELRKKIKAFGLESSFVCTGEAFADRMPGGATVPGVYEDGLHTSDPGSDCVFVMWMGVNYLVADGKNANQSTRLYRARSKLERDLWIHAIQFEIERAIVSSLSGGTRRSAA